MSRLSRRAFLEVCAATGVAMALGPRRWGWAQEASPFGPLQDDPILRLPEGFSYRIVAQTGTPLLDGLGPYPRPNFPDLNVVFPLSNGRLLLATSHEIPPEFPLLTPPPGEDYDPVAGGSVTSLILQPDLSIAESAYSAGGMIMNCSGSGTPWGTVLTGEEATNDLAAPHGFVWEVDPMTHTKVRLDACGRFDHETAVVDPRSGVVYLTEDSGTDSLLYRMIPEEPGNLAAGGALEAYKADGTWVPITDPSADTAAQGVALGARRFARLEGGRFDPLAPSRFYFTETEDDAGCGRVWRLDVDTGVLETFAQGDPNGVLCMPDNVAFDLAGNLFVCEDRGQAGPSNRNQIVFIDRQGNMAVFAELVQTVFTPGPVNIADEITGPAFTPDGAVLFVNLQRGAPLAGLTVALEGPFAGVA
ncbi:MAG: alkaline phosphatase PhoX [Candidatus Binatia bacterium]